MSGGSLPTFFSTLIFPACFLHRRKDIGGRDQPYQIAAFIGNREVMDVLLLHHTRTFLQRPVGAGSNQRTRHDLTNSRLSRVTILRHDLVTYIGGGHDPVCGILIADIHNHTVNIAPAHQCQRMGNANAWETLESGSTTTTGLDIQSRTVLGIISPPVVFFSAGYYFTTNSIESIANREPSSALTSCNWIRITVPDKTFPSMMV